MIPQTILILIRDRHTISANQQLMPLNHTRSHAEPGMLWYQLLCARQQPLWGIHQPGGDWCSRRRTQYEKNRE